MPCFCHVSDPEIHPNLTDAPLCHLRQRQNFTGASYFCNETTIYLPSANKGMIPYFKPHNPPLLYRPIQFSTSRHCGQLRLRAYPHYEQGSTSGETKAFPGNFPKCAEPFKQKQPGRQADQTSLEHLGCILVHPWLKAETAEVLKSRPARCTSLTTTRV
ncbi:hypothetical protein BDZ89DRAFT_776344 [Hymenopellis radicata]|nr:hypothetical protein BDZ89DRAFT_776344 [Hymenopellis radicata]